MQINGAKGGNLTSYGVIDKQTRLLTTKILNAADKESTKKARIFTSAAAVVVLILLAALGFYMINKAEGSGARGVATAAFEKEFNLEDDAYFISAYYKIEKAELRSHASADFLSQYGDMAITGAKRVVISYPNEASDQPLYHYYDLARIRGKWVIAGEGEM